MRILMLTHHPPYPHISGGRVRAYELLRRLARAHDVTLIYFATPAEDTRATRAHLGEICDRVEEIPTEIAVKSRGRLGISSASRWPSKCLPYVSRRASDAVSSLLGGGRFDIVHCAGYYMAQILPRNPGVPVILAEDNVEYICSWRRLLVANNLSDMVAAFLEYVREKRLEISVWQSVAACIFTSEIEKTLVHSRVRTRVEVVPNGVDPEHFDDTKMRGATRSWPVGMLANFRYRPNLDSLQYFRDRILPHLDSSYTYPILLIGNAGSDLFAQIRGDTRFVATGQVPDIRPYLASVDVVVCPLRMGGGTKIKILESLAMRRSVISTSIGAEGFGVRNWQELVITDSPRSFASALRYLLSNQELRRSLGIKGRLYVTSNHNWDASASLVESIYRSLPAPPRAAS